jgi:CheY-like chemotaxis protein
VNQVFVRSEQLANKIYDIKLHIPEWKVLFAIDGRMTGSELAGFLEFDETEVDKALNTLQELELIVPEGGEESPAEELQEAAEGIGAIDETFEMFERVEEEQESPPEEETEPVSEEPSEVSSQVESEEEPGQEFDAGDLIEEQPAEEPETPEQPQWEEPPVPEMPEEVSEGEEEETEMEETTFDVPVEQAEEGVGDEFEELTLEGMDEEENKSDEPEQDLDSLINDLLKEETSGEEEEPKILDDAEMAAWEDEQVPEETAEAPVEEETAQAEPATEDLDIPVETEEEQPEVAEEESAPVESVEPEEEVETVETPVSGEGQKTILVVDDSIVIRKMVEIALENENYNVVSVATGKEAFSYLDSKDPEMVILDIMLPDVNGLDILKAIKAKKNIPVVMLSAKDTPKETSKAKELGADDFIPKPFRDEELISKIHELIGQ